MKHFLGAILALNFLSIADAAPAASPASYESVSKVCVAHAGTPTSGVAPSFALLMSSQEVVEHGGGLNGCGCHFNRKTGECHCHQPRACGCSCQPGYCK
jgi:hypothetical protein